MKVYSLGNKAGPALMLLPGSCCHWKSNFAPVLPLLEPHFHVLCVSYDGFDETEPDTTFPTMEEEAAKIEALHQREPGRPSPRGLRLQPGRQFRGPAGGTAEHPHGLRHSG